MIANRLATHGAVSTSLTMRSDHALRELVDSAAPLGSGIGGRSALLEIDGTSVFVKQIPLTDLERLPENSQSTANIFGLPAFCQYGIGGPGFGVWRELAVHTMTTNWVLTGQCQSFPLLHHWRVLPQATVPLPKELADVERAVDYWGGGTAVRRRIEELGQASAGVILFLEYIPQNLHEWLGKQLQDGEGAADRACTFVERDLERTVAFMNARGLLHFDAHFENILTDGRRLYFTDFGLALSSRFDLPPDQIDFYERHRSYDRCYTVTHLVHWLLSALHGHDTEKRDALLRTHAAGLRPTGIPGAAAEIIARHAPLAAVMTDFYRKLQGESRQTPYPTAEIRRLG